VQCEKFNLATLIPFKINSFITFGSLLAGPKVQMNFDLHRLTRDILLLLLLLLLVMVVVLIYVCVYVCIYLWSL
jgi:hypothetical protein